MLLVVTVQILVRLQFPYCRRWQQGPLAKHREEPTRTAPEQSSVACAKDMLRVITLVYEIPSAPESQVLRQQGYGDLANRHRHMAHGGNLPKKWDDC